MTKKYIQLRKTRDLGALFNDLFAFFRTEFKPLMLGITLVGGIPFLLLGIPQVILLDDFMNWGETRFQGPMPETLAGFFLIVLAKFYFTSLIIAFVNVYLRLYLDSQGTESVVMLEAVKKAFSVSIKSMGITFVYGIIASIASIFFVIPGIYVAVVFSLCYTAALADGFSISQSLDRSSKLIKDNWWFTFLIFIVLYVIMQILNNIVSIPLLFTGLFQQLLQPESAEGVEMSIGFWILSVFAEFASAFFQVILYLGLGIYYYSRVEAVESVGLLEQIKEIGESGSSEDEVQESY